MTTENNLVVFMAPNYNATFLSKFLWHFSKLKNSAPLSGGMLSLRSILREADTDVGRNCAAARKITRFTPTAPRHKRHCSPNAGPCRTRTQTQLQNPSP